jgi:hypothetical protein
MVAYKKDGRRHLTLQERWAMDSDVVKKGGVLFRKPITKIYDGFDAAFPPKKPKAPVVAENPISDKTSQILHNLKGKR